MYILAKKFKGQYQQNKMKSCIPRDYYHFLQNFSFIAARKLTKGSIIFMINDK